MLEFSRAHSLFLEPCNRALRGSRPFGDVRFPGQERSSLMTVTDVVWIKRMFGDLELSEPERDSWAARINRDQNPETGMYRYPPETYHVDAHATWQCVAALNMLGREPRYRLSCLEPLIGVAGFKEWCHAYGPEASHHRFLLAVIAAASADPDEEWRGVFARWYDAHQDPESGFPFHAGHPHRLSPAFLLTTMRWAFCGSVPRADRIVNTVLGFQREWGGFTDRDLPGYMEMDASFLLHLLCDEVPGRRGEIDAALEGVGRFIEAVLGRADRRSRLLSDLHAGLGVCGNLRVLWRHFGSPLPAPVPFPWAELEHYRVALKWEESD